MRPSALMLLIITLLLFVPSAVAQSETPARSALEVAYLVEFESTWSATTHPSGAAVFPVGAHWSPLIGGTHSAAADFWQPGALASDGIESMAETGQTALLSAEINAAITAGTAYNVILGNALATATGVISRTIEVHTNYPLVTLVTMIAPSPDWFSGVDGLALQDMHGVWLQTVAIDVYAWDAGTDSGSYYTSANADTNPADPITDLTGSYPFANAPVGRMTFTLLQPTAVPLAQPPAVGPIGLSWLPLLMLCLTAASMAAIGRTAKRQPV